MNTTSTTPAAATPTTPARGTCPWCLGTFATKGGTMVKHGYKAPGRGTGYAPHQGGQCGATQNYKPLEISPVGSQEVLALLDRQEAEKLALVAACDNGTITHIDRSEWQKATLRYPAHYALVQYSKTSFEAMVASSPRNTGDWQNEIEMYGRKITREIKALGEFRAEIKAALVRFGW